LAVKLTDLGFVKGVIAECIVSTYNANGKATAAPKGVNIIDDEHLIIDFFNTSATYANIRTHRCAAINLTSDIEVFYKTCFKEANPEEMPPQEWFENAKIVNAPKLRLADAAIEISIYNLEAVSAEKVRASFKVRSLQSQEKYPQVYCRAFSATLEAIIHATRVKEFLNGPNERKQVSKLLELIDNCNCTVNRVAPNTVYSSVMADLTKRIDSWMIKTEKQL